VRLGAGNAPVACIFSDLRGFATLAPELPGADICRALIGPLLERGSTIVVPTFSYTTQGTFNVRETPTALGALSKWVMRLPEAVRSEHPLFSFAAIGPRAALVRDCGHSAFGAQSVFDRLRAVGCTMIHLGYDVARGNTMIHYVEQVCGATYRLHKRFPTRVVRDGREFGDLYTAFVRRRDVPGHDFATDAKASNEALRAARILREEGDVGRQTNVSVFDYDAALGFLEDFFHRDPDGFLSKPFLRNA